MKYPIVVALSCFFLSSTFFTGYAQSDFSDINTLLENSSSANFETVYKSIEQKVTALPINEAMKCNDLLLQTAAGLPIFETAFPKIYRLSVDTYHRSSNDKEFLLYLLSIYDEPMYSKPYFQKIMLYDVACFYYSIGSFSQSENFFQQYLSVDAPFKTGEKVNALTSLGLILESRKSYDSSVVYFKKALAYAEEIASTEWIGLANGNLGMLYMQMGDYEHAEPHFNIDVRISQAVNSYGSAAGSYAMLGRIAMFEKNLPHAKATLDSALSLLAKVPPENYYINARADTYKVMAEYYSKIGDGDSAYYYLDKAFSITDSMHNDKNQAIVRFKITVFNLEKQQQSALLLKASEERNLQKERFVIITIVAALLITGILIISVRQKQKINQMLQEKSAATQAESALIQQQKDKQEQLNKTKDKLFSLIAHDLRGPIGNLKTMVGMVEAKAFTQEEFMAMLPEMKAKVDGVYDVADNLLRWAYAQIDGLTVKPENVSVETIVRKVFALLDADATRKSIALTTNLPPATTVFADPNLLEIIIRNLVSNAIKFSPANTVIEIEQHSQNNETIISVKDNGVGINAGLMEKLAKGEFSKPATGTGGEKGIGLGLVMCKEFTEANNGRIWATQNSPSGSVFNIALPMAK